MCNKYDGSQVLREKYPKRYIKKSHTIVCSKCGKEFEVICTDNRFERGAYKKFCSRACANSHHRTEESKEKTSQTLLRKYEDLDPDRVRNRRYKLFKCQCSICGKAFESRTRGANHCSQKCLMADPLIKEKLRNAQLNLIAEGKHTGWISRNISSYPEKFWMTVLDNNGIKYEREVYIKQYQYFLDFVIKKDDRIINLEIDGRQHLEREAREHDNLRDARMTSLGYEVYRVLWNEINTQEGKDDMKLKINNFLSFLNK